MIMEVVKDWGRWFKDKGVKPVHVRRWLDPDEGFSSGAVRTDDGTVWSWSREDGVPKVWSAHADNDWDGSEMGAIPGMSEATDEVECLRLLSREDPSDADASVDAVNARRDRGLRDVFG